MEYKDFANKCRNEPTVSDFESYITYCIFEAGGRSDCTLEMYSFIRDLAFEKRDDKATRLLFELAGAAKWKEGEWEGALR
jgi:hypothetical protein